MKNWVVISKAIQEKEIGVIKYLTYLTSENHDNHRDKTRIVPIHNSVDRFIEQTLKDVTQRNLARIKAKKGGRDIASFCQSYTLTLPPDISLLDEQWKQIAMFVYSDLADYLGITKKQLGRYCFINLHDQSNQHINFVISKVINGNVCRELQRKSIIRMLKQSFNSAVLKVANIQHSTYCPNTSRAKRFPKPFFINNENLINATHKNHDVSPYRLVTGENETKKGLTKIKPKLTRTLI